MPKPNGRLPALPALVLFASLAVLMTACSGGPTLPGASGPLVTITTQGGECFAPPCGSTFTIERDGIVRTADKPPNELGTVPANVLTALDAAVKTTDFAAVRAIPFQGECPTAFDGQEWIYEFSAPTGVERIASCESDVDPNHPLFAATMAALVAVDVLPAP